MQAPKDAKVAAVAGKQRVEGRVLRPSAQVHFSNMSRLGPRLPCLAPVRF